MDRTPIPSPTIEKIKNPVGRPRKPAEPRIWPNVICADDLEPREMKWLWAPYLPVGTVSMLFGPGGIGKSHIACDIAAALSKGRQLPGQNETHQRRPQKVLMMSAEDDMRVVMLPRLINAGADLRHIWIPDGLITLDGDGIKHVSHIMQEFACTVAFIDPVVAYMGGRIDMNRMNEVREFTGALAQAAMKSDTSVILVHHSRKGKDGEDYEKAAGSVDFINSVRSTLYCNRTAEGVRYMKHVKSNYSAPGPTLTYDFGTDDHFHWTGIIDDDLLVQIQTPTSTGQGGARKRAIDFIKQTLSQGPVEAAEILKIAEIEGFNNKTLQRAKEGVAESFVTTDLNGNKNVWHWRLING